MVQQPHQQAAEQHLARLRQQDSAVRLPALAQHRQSLTASDHNPWAAEAALEAHLSNNLHSQPVERK